MHVIDSHTGGEPTRVILEGAPDLGSGSLADRAARLAADHQDFCRSVLGEPRGQVAMVAALLVTPQDRSCVAGVIYFDADAVLGMCGHGTIGLAMTLAHQGRIGIGAHRIETPAGVVTVRLHDSNTVTVTNIESRRIAHAVKVDVPGYGQVTGDIAYGGNWFFIVEPSPTAVRPENIRSLTDMAIAVRTAVTKLRGDEDAAAQVDHVILQDRPAIGGAQGRSFVLCPDDTYDRSPCGTGSSARLACLAADGRLDPETDIDVYSVIGSSYRLSYRPGRNGGVIPSITGQAHVMADTRLIFAPDDPFRTGIEL